MTKIYCIKRNKCRKFKNPIISYIFYKIFALSIICDKAVVKIYMAEENISQKFRLNYIDEARNYFSEETNENEMISEKHKKVCTLLNHNQQLLFLISVVAGCISISGFASLVGTRNKNLSNNRRN